MKSLKPIPEFKNLEDEGKFWDTHDSTEYVDWFNAQKITLSLIKVNLSERTESAIKSGK